MFRCLVHVHQCIVFPPLNLARLSLLETTSTHPAPESTRKRQHANTKEDCNACLS